MYLLARRIKAVHDFVDCQFVTLAVSFVHAPGQLHIHVRVHTCTRIFHR